MPLNSILIRGYNRAIRNFNGRLRSLIHDPIVVLNYHQVRAPIAQINHLAVSDFHFDQQMEVLASRYNVIRVDQILQELTKSSRSNPSDKPRVVITFDDGYSDIGHTVAPILRKYGIPATFYITTGMLDGHMQFWWDECEHLILHGIPSMNSLILKKLPLGVPALKATRLITIEDREHYYHSLVQSIGHLEPNLIQNVVEELRQIATLTTFDPGPKCAISTTLLLELSKDPLFSFGSHTVRHPSLGSMPRDLQFKEMKDSKLFLESLLAQPINSISYPFGSNADFTPTTLSVARSLGFSTGFTTIQAQATKGLDPLAIPRMFVKNWNGPEFDKQLTHFFKWS